MKFHFVSTIVQQFVFVAVPLLLPLTCHCDEVEGCQGSHSGLAWLKTRAKHAG